MSLHTPSSGIFGTNVSWRDIEEAIQEALNTTAHFGPEKKVTNIGDMKGFLSRVCLVEPDWQGENSEKLPSKFIAKISSALALLDMIKMMEDNGKAEIFNEAQIVAMDDLVREFHNKEVKTYKLLTKLQNPSIPFTKIYATKEYTETNRTQGFILCQYRENNYTVQLYESVPKIQINKCLKAIAAISALGETLPEEEFDYLPNVDFVTRIMDLTFGGSSKEQKSASLTNMLPEKYVELEEKCKKIFLYLADRDIYSRFAKMDKYFGYKKVIVHADLWTSNILFQKIDKDIELRAIIDFQTICWGSPALDLARFILSAASGPDRRAHTEEMLETYYEYFLDELAGRQVPYTLQQLKDSYNLFLPMSSFFLLPAIGALRKHWTASSDNAEEVIRGIDERAVYIVEDVIEQHEKNLQEFSDFFTKDIDSF